MKRVLATVIAAVVLSGCGSAAVPNASAPPSRKPATPTQPLASKAAIAAALARYSSAASPIYCGGTAKPWVALTFDDGPGPYTNHMVALLRDHDVPATFFVVGRNVTPYAKGLDAERRYHAPIGDHSWSHPLLTSLPAGQQRAQIVNTKRAIEGAAAPTVRLFRPPYGARNAVTDKFSHRAGMATILWNVDSMDALGADSKRIARRVKHGLRPGAIILLHENRGQTVRAIRYSILPYLKKSGMTPVTIPQMLAGNPPTREQLARGRKGCFR